MKLNARMKKIIAVTTTFLAIALISATGLAAAWDGSKEATIIAIRVHGSNNVRIQFDRDVCTSAGNKRWADINEGANVNGQVWSNESMARVLSIATAAKLSGSKVWVHAMNGGSYCQMGALTLQ